MLGLKYNKISKLHILPNLITYINMSLGAVAIFISSNGSPNNIKIAAMLILIAGLTDKLDGFTARKLGVASKFGKELDSLCDTISFGVAPLVLWWNMNNGLLGIYEILVSLFFIGSGVFRLARFNVMEEEYIVGLPITIAGMVMGLKHLLDISHRFSFVNRAIINIENIIIMISLSLLMVSSFKIKKPKIL
ncbi:MAG: CDP-diacylglycerol--serine O-phosphatidyltransferase [Tissierellia bacterium]|nr:CDP-diacylglycerol--serine O-phosphatidyltransferase [Tissierellia bacterium]